jgi:type II secretory pathway pseudopilin PulG
MPRRLASQRGFSLPEVLVASTTLLLSLSAVAQLLTSTALATRRARVVTQAAVLAQQKLEALLPRALDGTLIASPANALAANVDGFCDFVDAAGAPLDVGSAPPAGTAYVRRWAVAPVAGSATAAFAITVLVVDARRSGIDARLVDIVRSTP